MKTYQFKSNIKCSGCISKVSPVLEGEKRIQNWNVNLLDPNRVLSVSGDGITENEIVELIQKAGYKLEKI